MHIRFGSIVVGSEYNAAIILFLAAILERKWIVRIVNIRPFTLFDRDLALNVADYPES